MAYLFCEKCGKEYEKNLKPFPDEYTRIVEGKLFYDGLLCDSCNRKLQIGDGAFLFSYFNYDPTDYPLHYESLYFGAINLYKVRIRII